MSLDPSLLDAWLAAGSLPDLAVTGVRDLIQSLSDTKDDLRQAQDQLDEREVQEKARYDDLNASYVKLGERSDRFQRLYDLGNIERNRLEAEVKDLRAQVDMLTECFRALCDQ